MYRINILVGGHKDSQGALSPKIPLLATIQYIFLNVFVLVLVNVDSKHHYLDNMSPDSKFSNCTDETLRSSSDIPLLLQSLDS